MSSPARAQLAALCAALVVAGAPSARASTYDIFGFTARDIAMGGAMTGAALGYSAVYYNPAALTSDKHHRLGLGLTLTVPDLFVDRSLASGDHPTVTPSTHVGVNLGWQYPIGGIFEDRLAFGLALNVPANRLLRVQGIDPQSPQFYMFQNLQDKLLINAGFAAEPVSWLSLGLGVQVLADVAGAVRLDMNILSGDFDRREITVDLEPTAALFAGVHLRPLQGLSVGLSYRGSSSLQFQLPVTVREGDALDLTIDVSQTVLWSPHQLAIGLAYDLGDPALRVVADLTLAMWSDAPDPSPQLGVDVGGRLLDAFGLGSALDLSTRSAPIELAFSDIVVPRVGVEWAPTGDLDLRAGYFFRPTPAPRQTGVTAYLDNDAHVLSLGAGVALLQGQAARDSRIQLDIAAQVTLLARRAILRRDVLDPVGDLGHGGVLWTLNATITHLF